MKTILKPLLQRINFVTGVNNAGSALLLICFFTALITVLCTTIWWTLSFQTEAIHMRIKREKEERIAEALLLYGIACYRAPNKKIKKQIAESSADNEILIYAGPWYGTQARLALIPQGGHAAEIVATTSNRTLSCQAERTGGRAVGRGRVQTRYWQRK